MRCARYESQFAANHLGHFQLTCRLWPALVAAESARVVALSSNGHRRAGVYFHDPNFERREYDPRVAYGQSKTANALFAVALDSMVNVKEYTLSPCIPRHRDGFDLAHVAGPDRCE